MDPSDKKGELAQAGRSAEKHGSRGGAFPPTKGNAAAKNDQGQRTLEDIVRDPDSTIEVDERGRTEVLSPDGRGAQYNKDGSFKGFREPDPPVPTS